MIFIKCIIIIYFIFRLTIYSGFFGKIKCSLGKKLELFMVEFFVCLRCSLSLSQIKLINTCLFPPVIGSTLCRRLDLNIMASPISNLNSLFKSTNLKIHLYNYSFLINKLLLTFCEIPFLSVYLYMVYKNLYHHNKSQS